MSKALLNTAISNIFKGYEVSVPSLKTISYTLIFLCMVKVGVKYFQQKLNASKKQISYQSPSEALFFCAQHGNVEGVKKGLTFGFDPNSRHPDNGKTALIMAAEKGHFNVVRELLLHKAALHLVDNRGRTALHWASSGGHQRVVEILVERGASVNVQDLEGRTPLMFGAQFPLALQELLKASEKDLRLQDQDGRTVFHFAALSAHPRSISTLKNENVDLTITDNQGITPFSLLLISEEVGFDQFYQIFFANDSSSDKIIEAFKKLSPKWQGLIEKSSKKFLMLQRQDPTQGFLDILQNPRKTFDPEVGVTNPPMGMALLLIKDNPHKWVKEEERDIFECILPFLNSKNIGEAFDLVLQYQPSVVVRKMLQNQNLDPHGKNAKGVPFLHTAIRRKDHGFNIASTLISQCKVDQLNIADSEGNTPAHIAAELGALTILQKLDQKNVNWMALNGKKESPIHKALENNHEECALFLIEKLNQEQLAEIRIEGFSLYEYAVLHSVKFLKQNLCKKGLRFTLNERNQTKLIEALLRKVLNNLKLQVEYSNVITKEYIQIITALEERFSNQNNAQNASSQIVEQYKQACLTFLRQSEICENHREKETFSELGDFIYPTLSMEPFLRDIAATISSETIQTHLKKLKKNLKKLPSVEFSISSVFDLISATCKQFIRAKKASQNAFEQKVRSSASFLKEPWVIEYIFS